MAHAAGAELTDRQLAFCDEYLVDFDASNAAKRAGYAKKSAKQVGHRLLQDARIKVRIKERMVARQARVELTQDNVIEELRRVAFSDVRQMFRWREEAVEFIPSDSLEDDVTAAIQAVKSKTRVISLGEHAPPITEIQLEIKTHPKVPALLALKKHLSEEDPDEILGSEKKPFIIKVVRE